MSRLKNNYSDEDYDRIARKFLDRFKDFKPEFTGVSISDEIKSAMYHWMSDPDKKKIEAAVDRLTIPAE